MTESIDDLKRAAEQASEVQEKLAGEFFANAEGLTKDSISIDKLLGSHKTKNNVVEAVRNAAKALKDAAESCSRSAKATREYVAQQFGAK